MWKSIRNEEGNIALFVLGMLSIIMILLIFVLNLGAALATKEDSTTTVQQASLSGSSVLYEEVRKVIYDYEHDTLEGALQAFFKDIEEDVDDRATALANNGAYNDWSQNEIEVEAFDQVLTEELNKDVVRQKLHELLQNKHIERKVINEVKDTITDNGGKLEGAVLYIRDNRFYVRAANEMESVSFDGYMEGLEENVYQESAGPEIDFLDEIWNYSYTIPLDN
ncbi:Tad domain-containing protein [Virgibacillus siamensis]|uniref:Tad domain-containing protein n=1 Tax=Virgibacillus siamensis TaxID=480071 RepID=UPI000984C48B|nr:Tad domain-containing protein [Virgibacillus siamensis]